MITLRQDLGGLGYRSVATWKTHLQTVVVSCAWVNSADTHSVLDRGEIFEIAF